MTTDHIDAVARAGFASYHASRPWHRWEEQPFPTTCRWTIIAAAFCNGNHDGHTVLGMARNLRSAYTDGIFSTPHSFRTDRDWQRVYAVMARARDAVMAERMAA